MKTQSKKSVVKQIVKPLGLFLLLLITAMIILMFFYSIDQALSERGEKSRQISKYTTNRVTDYAAAGWLAEYWETNCKDMELIYYDAVADVLEKELMESLPGYSGAKKVTRKQIEEAPANVQKTFAEYCYARISLDLDSVKREFGPSYLDLITIRGEECLFLADGLGWGELHISQGGNIFELGSTMPFAPGVYPVLDKILANSMPDNTMEVSLSQGADHSNIRTFEPVYDENGNIVMIVSVSQQWDDILSDTVKMTLISILVVAVLFLLIGVVTVRLIKTYVVRPIKKEETVLGVYIRDKDPVKAMTALEEIKTNNEIQTLAENFSYMASEIDMYIKEVQSVTAEKERIGAELDMAANIQASQLPSKFPAFPERNEFEIFASMDPAKEVGGDFYDFFLVDDDHLALVIADVSGKGVPAALFMMSSKMLINSFALLSGTPSEILGAVNNRICEHNSDNMFVTVWLAILDIRTGKLTCSNAGHEYPALKKAGGSFELIKSRHSPVVGAMPGINYREHEIQLEPGDTIFVYTDGAPEATNGAVELFGNERLTDALNSAGDVSLEGLLSSVKGTIDEFVGDAPQFDDLTMLALRYNGKQ